MNLGQFIESVRLWGLEKFGRYYSKYRAIVLDSLPDSQYTGNIVVKVPRVQGGMKLVARAKAFKGGPGYGQKFFTPKPGEVVWVEFENGNPSMALWSYHTWGFGECPDELADINTCGIVTPHGHQLIIKESEEGDKISITFNEGNKIELTPETFIFTSGENKSLVNIEPLRWFIQAVAKDLIIAKSGSNVMQWMGKADGFSALEDTKTTH